MQLNRTILSAGTEPEWGMPDNFKYARLVEAKIPQTAKPYLLDTTKSLDVGSTSSPKDPGS